MRFGLKKFMFDIRVEYLWHLYQYLKFETVAYKSFDKEKIKSIMICAQAQM